MAAGRSLCWARKMRSSGSSDSASQSICGPVSSSCRASAACLAGRLAE